MSSLTNNAKKIKLKILVLYNYNFEQFEIWIFQANSKTCFIICIKATLLYVLSDLCQTCRWGYRISLFESLFFHYDFSSRNIFSSLFISPVYFVVLCTFFVIEDSLTTFYFIFGKNFYRKIWNWQRQNITHKFCHNSVKSKLKKQLNFVISLHILLT